MSLPVADSWYRATRLDAATTLILEPHVHPLEQANMFLVEGRDRDLIIDSGMGVAPLRPFLDGLRGDPGKPLVHVATHTHIDHIGAVHEFDARLVHPAEAANMAEPAGIRSLRSADFGPPLIALFEKAGYPPLWPLLIDALPWAGYDPDSYRLRGAPATGLIDEGDTVDLGERRFVVLHLPGHSPGGVGLYEPESGVLFAGDAIYDGPLIYEGPGMDPAVYARTLRRLRDLAVTIVHGGHDPSFGPERLRAICDAYLPRLEAGGAPAP
jgi:glyoxylase-like metal-dependent hydrolase (beta-lactamase superfamily II)